MRVAVHHPEREEDGETVPASVSAFRLGRLTPETGINHFTGDHLSVEQQAEALLKQAKAEFPDCEIVLERLIDNGDETSSWVRVEDVPEGAVSPDGTTIARELVAEQGSDAGGAA
jgi:hypothetical protein